MSRKHVAVIGAGQAGLSTIKQLADYSNNFTIVGFERAAEIGGQWLYSEETDIDKYGLRVFSSMYDKLLINIPRELMTLPDFPHTETGHSYLNRHQIFKYLQDYASYYELQQFVKFQTLVTKVKPLSKTPDTKWEVTYHHLDNKGDTKTVIFDSVIVCQGHNDSPHLVEIPGLEKFQGVVMHSHTYRKSTTFMNKRVVLLGSSFSGLDLSNQLSEVACKIYLAHRGDPLPSKLPDTVIEKGLITRFKETTVVFDDGSEEEVDVFIMCTGFNYSLTFLDDVVKVTNGHVVPFYKHVIHIEHPTLMFVGLPREIAYFRLNHENARFVVRCLLDMVQLPPKEEMYEDDKKWLENTARLGYPTHKARYFGKDDLQWIWNKDLAKLGGFPSLPPAMKKMWDIALGKLITDFVHFRKYDYKITGRDSIEVMDTGKTNKYE